MLALIYLIVMVMLGDLICRRFYSFVSLPHRLAAAFLSGLLFSSWATYLIARLFANSANPLLWGNLLFFVIAVGLILWLRKDAPVKQAKEGISPQTAEANKWDWAFIGIFLVVACWQMFGTFNMSGGKLQIANHQWSDFGPNVAISQSFALGHNFPTEYPHFSGEHIHYHFLYYFQIGNLEYLGLNPALSNNLLSILSLVSMLILVMTLGVVLFNSRVVGRIGAVLFFFHGTLSFIPFIWSQGSIGKAINKALTMQDFLPSIFTYRGELWGIWSQVVFINQRHFASSIGLLLLVLAFLFIRYRAASPDSKAAENNETNEEVETETASKNGWLNDLVKPAAPFIFSGLLLGLTPLWNSAIFVSAFAVLAVLFLLFPLKKQMIVLAVTTAIVALPQIIFLKSGNMRETGSMFYWGYIVENPTLLNVTKYLAFTFGFKLFLIALALYFATWFERRVMIAISSLFAIVFFLKFSDEVLTNHKFINIWLIVANIFVAYGLWRLWNADVLKNVIASRIISVVLVVFITASGVFDLFPIRNSFWMEIPFENDKLVGWVREQTDPKAIFLTNRYVNHQIFLAGRRVFYGHPYYAWGAGYRTGERDVVYKTMFETRNPPELMKLLAENKISYVAIDNALRNDSFIKNINESVHASYFDKVFEDTEGKHDGLKIYKVPADLSNLIPKNPNASDSANVDESFPPVNAFDGGKGKGRGLFAAPKGIAADGEGNFYVADTGNGRIQKFSPKGEFIAVFGKQGGGDGELRAPRGIAIDSNGDVYVADEQNHRLVKFKADGSFIKQWGEAELGLKYPRDIAFGADKQLYILDSGKARILKFNPETGNTSEWGRSGEGEGGFSTMTGLTVSGERIYVADAKNDLVQIFDLSGKFIGQWSIPQWAKYIWHYPDVTVDEQSKRVYITSGWTREVLVFDTNGNYLESIKPEGKDELNNPSSVVLSDTKSGKRLYVLNTGGDVVDTGGARVYLSELPAKKSK